MGYVSEMRALIGHRPLMIVGASVIVEDGAGRVLLQRRADNGCWGYAGGCVELGETTEEAARRELLEEMGLTAGRLEFFGVFSGEATHYVYPNGDDAYIVDVVYLCRDYTGAPTRQEDEVTAIQAFPPDALPEDINPPARVVLEEYLRQIR